MRVAVGKRLNSVGDTIVEVMIVLAVLGLSVGIAYATANRSLLNARQAQESSEGSSLAQHQIELLRAWADIPSSNTSQYIYQTDPFCIKGNAIVNIVTSPPNTCSSIPGYNARYNVSITRDAATDTFTVRVTWDDILGQGTDSATLIYRVHPTQ